VPHGLDILHLHTPQSESLSLIFGPVDIRTCTPSPDSPPRLCFLKVGMRSVEVQHLESWSSLLANV